MRSQRSASAGCSWPFALRVINGSYRFRNTQRCQPLTFWEPSRVTRSSGVATVIVSNAAARTVPNDSAPASAKAQNSTPRCSAELRCGRFGVGCSMSCLPPWTSSSFRESCFLCQCDVVLTHNRYGYTVHPHEHDGIPTSSHQQRNHQVFTRSIACSTIAYEVMIGATQLREGHYPHERQLRGRQQRPTELFPVLVRRTDCRARHRHTDLVKSRLVTGCGATPSRMPFARESSACRSNRTTSSMWIQLIHCLPLPNRPEADARNSGSIFASAPPAGRGRCPSSRSLLAHPDAHP